jgi:hypothetical protein
MMTNASESPGNRLQGTRLAAGATTCAPAAGAKVTPIERVAPVASPKPLYDAATDPGMIEARAPATGREGTFLVDHQH